MEDMQFNGTPEEWYALVKKNRQVTVKLYTEEQVRSLLDKMNVIYSLEDLTPIELPSDEEIEEKSFGHSDIYPNQASFRYGAKWMIDKIKGGNK